MRLAVVGSGGFFGSIIAEAAERLDGVKVVRVVRANYDEAKVSRAFDVVINAAMPSRRFWAETNRSGDFIETVEKTHRIASDFGPAKIVQISSVSARSQLDIVYGRHKRAAEVIVDDGRNLIVRLGPLYDEALSKGALVDIVRDNPVFVAGDSRYAFTPAAWAAGEVMRRIEETGTVEIGSRGAIRLWDLAQALCSASTFQGTVDDQVFDAAPEHAPFAREVLAFAKSARLRFRGITQ